ncbi:helix-turn-helix transcriptional regulator [Kitasatospora aureofaciens]|uniref:helix-turn-helix transcriptional regulator n=1 Tax=Kitasatospora aureofaciens TaxID=1894 RepID=UPI001C48C2F2|nr:XRE family transcriptional regulator [Kitasatospora aureofaciens]MBV6698021.1 helix-turn-helix domain-containing protein [Kitasatospora aureofaciens]
MAARRENFIKRRKALGFTQESLAQAVGVDRSTVGRWENGEVDPQAWHRPALMRTLRITADELDSLINVSSTSAAAPAVPATLADSGYDDELEALELVRRISASDVGDATLSRLELAFDELAIKYPTVPPRELLGQVRKYSGYVAHLMGAKKTLAEHRQLLVIGGWFSLLGATLHIDLNQQDAATARLRTAMTLAQHADHREIQAWCYETDAWRVLTDGNYSKAVELSKAAQYLAPKGSSVEIQATAQQGRAFARLGNSPETYAAISQVQSLSSSAGLPDQPEHHFRYDPAKSVAYTATTLAWLGDPAAETYAREVIARLAQPDDLSKWPRRVASANIDLALSLVATDRLDEACDAAQRAMLSGRVAPSNHWRALEVVKAVETRRISDAKDLRDVYEGMRLEIEPPKA